MDSFLIQPSTFFFFKFQTIQTNSLQKVQRICKYPLLFRELLKETKPIEECFIPLKKVLNQADDLARDINNHQNPEESFLRLEEIEKCLQGNKVLSFFFLLFF